MRSVYITDSLPLPYLLSPLHFWVVVVDRGLGCYNWRTTWKLFLALPYSLSSQFLLQLLPSFAICIRMYVYMYIYVSYLCR